MAPNGQRRYRSLKISWGLGMKLPRWCKSRTRILQSVLAAEDVEEAERKLLKMAEHEEAKAEATPEAKEAPDADEGIQAIKNS
ncbi:hypothetical protein JCGZ_06338 [Jatropha curcas]|uniref:Uncharacterized protein n=1 Tax=Jatropha curcas TaxID=180498 RepID=A0A067KN72_JATCU|nr:hypothetical protein JCGZ_06338 [Jatropha curcas]